MNFARYGIINAQKYPDKVFLIERTPSRNLRRVMTWREFNAETNQVANHLQKQLGIKKGDFVLHLQMNSLEWLVTFHAILRTGAVVVPLNYRFASADIKYAAGVCQPKAFILEDGFLPKVQPVQGEMKTIAHYLCIGENVPGDMISYAEIRKNGETEDLLVETAGDDLAELMFTSGTTGPPKAVCQAHDTLYNIGTGCALSYDEGHHTVYLAPHPFYHSGSLFLSLPSYLAGGQIVILKELTNPRWLLDAIAEEKVNNGWVTVPCMSDSVNAIKRGEIDINQYDFSHVTGSILIGAQPVPHSLFQDMKRIFPFKTGNIYGITEGGGGGSFNLFDEDVLERPGSIGKPTFNTEARAVDALGHDVPVGEVGELVLKGPRVMQGYFRNPELTARTVKDGWLYTGDLVKKDADGFFYIADRKKDLIIRGGENIFPVEIEAVLHRHPKIADAAVIGYPHERLVEIAMAVVELHAGETMTVEEVVGFCRQEGLAKYKWPEKVLFAKVLRNPTGKIQKFLMRQMYVEKSATV
ncbi:class I adenylate-forming enzyme family protein [Desulfotomaculum copahuensis]|uniref:AMP-binding protein n=1 Tax=Desulfotomaculum copahuensis TaxID=1838280 RepID=A0A1B7LGN4_9FIRM|nr:class I adenylate-forming enzyme family protein [Desulfotomaculum copahuensis]OAT85263.1 AMP-binding protein [Desulfotomaculum copahuensis]